MCGIFGNVYFPSNRPLGDKEAEFCLNTLRHRGPDGGSLLRGDGFMFGHRRLAILDTSAKADQPMRYADGRFTMVFNGEIYNFLELRQELVAKGYKFHTESDSEVLMAAFAEWREKCLNRLNGMWAFAIWDEKTKELFLARDRFGKKPLFYFHDHKRGFAFASEMKALTPLLDKVTPNEALLRDYDAMFRYEATDACLIQELSRLPAGHYAWLKNQKLSVHRFWCTLDHLQPVPERYEDQVEKFREIFTNACRLRMRSDVPVGTALSGGLDSSTVLSVMTQIQRSAGDRSRILDLGNRAVVASFPGSPLDETRFARQLADHLHVSLESKVIDPNASALSLDESLYLFEDIYLTSPIPFVLTYAAIRQAGIKVTLDGHGADEVFGGYAFDYLQALADTGLDFPSAFQIIEAFEASSPFGSASGSSAARKLWFYAKWKARRAAKDLVGKPTAVSRDSSHPAWAKLDFLNKVLYSSTHDTILPTLLRNYDRYSMANGVEIRMPFMDHRLITFGFSIPWKSKVRGGFSKAIVRDSFASLMPPEISYRRTKIGFNSPMAEWMKGPMKPYFLDLLASAEFRNSGLIDSKAVAAKVRGVIENPASTFFQAEEAWRLVSPVLWERSFLKRAAAKPASG